MRLPRPSMTLPLDGGVKLSIGDLEGFVPEALAPLLSRYLAERDEAFGTDSPHLFPGRPSSEPITVSAVRHHLDKWNLSIEKMGMAARAKNKLATKAVRKAATRSSQ